MAWVEPAFSLAMRPTVSSRLASRRTMSSSTWLRRWRNSFRPGFGVSLLMRVQAYQVAVHRHTLADPLAVYGGETAMPMA